MKKLLLSVAVFMSVSLCMAQTAPINQAPAQLAEQMVTSISNDVTLTTEQQTQLLTAATQYFTDLRNAAQSTPQTRTALYEQFLQTIKSIMSDDLYEQWRNTLNGKICSIFFYGYNYTRKTMIINNIINEAINEIFKSDLSQIDLKVSFIEYCLKELKYLLLEKRENLTIA
jgi:hypothetical protein